MKNELPCEIIKDLLPTYIDGLASAATSQAVEEHMKGCSECAALHNTMKKQCPMGTEEKTKDTETEKALFKKINKKLTRKTRNTAIAGIIAVIAVICASQLLFVRALKDVPLSEVSVSASVYPIKELAAVSAETKTDGDAYSVVISKDESYDDPIFSISIPDTAYSNIGITESAMNECEYVSLISWDSPYVIKDISFDYSTSDGESIMYIKAFKTSLLNNKTAGDSTASSTIQFSDTDKIVYVDKNGTETILWEKQ